MQADKIENSNQIGLTVAKELEIDVNVKTKITEWREGEISDEQIALEIYNDHILKKPISKAIIAQCFAKILYEYSNRDEIKNRLLSDEKFSYIINAINYTTSGDINKVEDVDD